MRIAGFDVGFFVRPADGFAGCGDAVVARECRDHLLLVVIDVLGHGPAAHAVATDAEAVLEEVTVAEPEAVLALLHNHLAKSVGAAAGIAMLQSGAGRGRFVGVGNTVARIFGQSERRLVSADGVLGHRRPGSRPADFTLEPGEVLVMHSDGVTSRFESADYPMLRADEPTVVAREVIRRFGKPHDDAACLVARCAT